MFKKIIFIIILILCFTSMSYAYTDFESLGYDDCTVTERSILIYAGYYKNKRITIDIEEINSFKNIINLYEHVYLHEYGHYIWEEKLTAKQKLIYKNGYTKGKGYYSSVYECWAEDYARFEGGMNFIKFKSLKDGYDFQLMVDVLTLYTK